MAQKVVVCIGRVWAAGGGDVIALSDSSGEEDTAEEVYEALSELVFGEKGKTRATGLLARPRWRK